MPAGPAPTTMTSYLEPVSTIMPSLPRGGAVGEPSLPRLGLALVQRLQQLSGERPRR